MGITKKTYHPLSLRVLAGAQVYDLLRGDRHISYGTPQLIRKYYLNPGIMSADTWGELFMFSTGDYDTDYRQQLKLAYFHGKCFELECKIICGYPLKDKVLCETKYGECEDHPDVDLVWCEGCKKSLVDLEETDPDLTGHTADCGFVSCQDCGPMCECITCYGCDKPECETEFFDVLGNNYCTTCCDDLRAKLS